MALQVIGAGLGRTGTLSLKTALEELGFRKCYHMTDVMAHLEHAGVWDAAARGEAVDRDSLFHYWFIGSRTAGSRYARSWAFPFQRASPFRTGMILLNSARGSGGPS